MGPCRGPGLQALNEAHRSPELELLTPQDDRMYGSMVTVRFRRADLKPLWELSRKRRMWIIEASPMRISTHIHTRAADIELLFGTIREALGYLSPQYWPVCGGSVGGVDSGAD